jgi:hypothetical protein
VKVRIKPVLIAFLVSLIAVSILAGCGSSVPPLSPSAVVQQIYQYRQEKNKSTEAWNKVAANDFVKGFDMRKLLPLRGSVLTAYSIGETRMNSKKTPHIEKNEAYVRVTETIAFPKPDTGPLKEQDQTVDYSLTNQNGAWKISDLTTIGLFVPESEMPIAGKRTEINPFLPQK